MEIAMSANLKNLPQSERIRLESMSLPALIAAIERADFQCEGGPLKNFTCWLELKVRVLSSH
jgi:hypothetical protein